MKMLLQSLVLMSNVNIFKFLSEGMIMKCMNE